MAKRSGSMSKVITDYLVKNPEMTWKAAAPVLEPQGVSESYFCNQKTKLRNEGVLPKSKRKKTTRKSTSAKSTTTKKSPAPTRGPARKLTSAPEAGLASAADFARSAGGLDEARRLLEALSDIQI